MAGSAPKVAAGSGSDSASNGVRASAPPPAAPEKKENDSKMVFHEGEIVFDPSTGERGIVRFVGSIVSKKTGKAKLWVGVEWLSETRGKHKGEAKVDGKSYFTLSRGNLYMPPGQTTSGSFVKPAAVSRGRTFFGALKDKYEEAGANVKEIKTVTDTGAKVETVGMLQVKEQQRIGKLVRVSLDGCGVATAGDDSLEELCGGIQELNLGHNCIGEVQASH